MSVFALMGSLCRCRGWSSWSSVSSARRQRHLLQGSGSGLIIDSGDGSSLSLAGSGDGIDSLELWFDSPGGLAPAAAMKYLEGEIRGDDDCDGAAGGSAQPCDADDPEVECEAPLFPPGGHPASRVVVCGTDSAVGGGATAAAAAAAAATATAAAAALELPTLFRGEPDGNGVVPYDDASGTRFGYGFHVRSAFSSIPLMLECQQAHPGAWLVVSCDRASWSANMPVVLESLAGGGVGGAGGCRLAVRITDEAHVVDAALALQRAARQSGVLGVGGEGEGEGGGREGEGRGAESSAVGALLLPLDGKIWRAGLLFAGGGA